MDLDIAISRGNADKPAVVFIHGLGMDKDIWVNPSNSRILGGKLPLKILLCKRPSVKDYGLSKETPDETTSGFSVGEEPSDLKTIFNDLRLKEYPVITWSQGRPSGSIDHALSELNEVLKSAKELTGAGIILIGHSRGGLIGRKYLLKKDKSIRGLITISSPHKGSSIARIACYIKPLASLISPLFNDPAKGTLSSAIKHILDFLKSKAIKELLPESSFLKSLNDSPLDWIHYASVGGTEPTLFTLYRWGWDSTKGVESFRWFRKPDEVFSIPSLFEKVIPEKLCPEEIKKGKGDGLVSAESSRIPWCNEHYVFALNHAQILFHKDVRDLLVKEIDRISSS